MVPVSLTALLGRQRELEQAAELLGRTRLVTLTGAGGSGKTRLALELARRDHRDVTGVELAPVADPALVPQQILSALEMPEPPARDVLGVIIDALRERTMLLILDNCEHLVDACAAVAEAILRQCPGVTILTTTREAVKRVLRDGAYAARARQIANEMAGLDAPAEAAALIVELVGRVEVAATA